MVKIKCLTNTETCETNQTFIQQINDELEPLKTSFIWMMIALIVAILWVLYITYYNSRMFGALVSVILNRFVKKGHIQFGSLSFSVLTGKVMFRDVRYITEDFAIRALDGWMIFMWWRPY
ncbi:unnamed protein product, partial [Owenia fusiformis]